MAINEENSLVNTTGLSPDEKVLKIALARFDQIQENTSAARQESLEDLYFFGGRQWPEAIMRDRTEDRRPVLTNNKIPEFCYRIINDMRQNRPTIKIRPVDSLTDPDTAQVVDGMIRHILNNGNSKAAIDDATFYQVVCGIGYFRVLSEYIDDNSFDQELYLERIQNPFSVYFPVHLCKYADFSDAEYAFVRSRMSKDEFKLKYPKAKMANFASSSVGDANWEGKDYVFVAEYWNVEQEKKTIYELSDGTVIDDKKKVPKGLEIVDERDSIKKTIKWYLMSENEILEQKDWPGKYIPIIPVMGPEIPSADDTGKKTWISITRFLKDPQRSYNYFFTAYTEKVANSPKSPFLAAAGQIERFPEWKELNRKNLPFLRYSPLSHDGAPVPPPIRLPSVEVEGAFLQGITLSAQQMKEISGIYDSSLGAQSNEISGKAIIARQRQGDISNFHFIDNLARGYHLLGKILIDLIPIFYNRERMVRCLGEDMTDKIVSINTQHPGPDGRVYDMTVGNYDVVIDIGPSYETKRVEAATTLAQVLPQIPLVGTVAPDLIMRMLDNPLSGEVADRLKRFIQAQPNMNGVIGQDEAGSTQEMQEQQMRAVVGDMQKLMQAHQQTMQQAQGLQQQNSQMQALIGNLQKALKDKQMEIQAKVHDTEVKAQTEIEKAKYALAQEHVRQSHNIISSNVDSAVKLHQIGQAPLSKQSASTPVQVPSTPVSAVQQGGLVQEQQGF